jgi:hypothetical protein
MRELILIEIIALPAERSRGRHNPRVVKREMSGFPTKARAAPPPRQRRRPGRRSGRHAGGSRPAAARAIRGEAEEAPAEQGLGVDRPSPILGAACPLLAGQRSVADRLLRVPRP